VNGDGMADIVGFGIDGTYVSLATGGGNFGPMTFEGAQFGTSSKAGSWTSNDQYPRLLADVNGDGMDDIVGFGIDGTYYALATGGGAFGPMTFKGSRFGTSAKAGSWSSEDKYPRLSGDVDGDSQAEIIGFGIDGTYESTFSGTFGGVATTQPASTRSAVAEIGSNQNSTLGNVDTVLGSAPTASPDQPPANDKVALLANYMASSFVSATDGYGSMTPTETPFANSGDISLAQPHQM